MKAGAVKECVDISDILPDFSVIRCPVCCKVIGEGKELSGTVRLKCPRCKALKVIEFK